MIRDEFNKWLNDFGSYFPALPAWSEKLEQPDVTIDGWFKTLQPFSLVGLARITDLMLSGQVEPIKPTEFPYFALEIRARVEFQIQKVEKRKNYVRDEKFSVPAFDGDMITALKHSNAVYALCRKYGHPIEVAAELAPHAVRLCDKPSRREREAADIDFEHFGISWSEVQSQAGTETETGIVRSA